MSFWRTCCGSGGVPQTATPIKALNMAKRQVAARPAKRTGACPGRNVLGSTGSVPDPGVSWAWPLSCWPRARGTAGSRHEISDPAVGQSVSPPRWTSGRHEPWQPPRRLVPGPKVVAATDQAAQRIAAS